MGLNSQQLCWLTGSSGCSPSSWNLVRKGSLSLGFWLGQCLLAGVFTQPHPHTQTEGRQYFHCTLATFHSNHAFPPLATVICPSDLLWPGGFAQTTSSLSSTPKLDGALSHQALGTLLRFLKQYETPKQNDWLQTAMGKVCSRN